MKDYRPIIGITMGDPVGIGPEIILLALEDSSLYKRCRPLVFGDIRILEAAGRCLNRPVALNKVKFPASGKYAPGSVDVIDHTDLDPAKMSWGNPSGLTGRAMITYIKCAVDMAIAGEISAVVTGPINKTAMKMAGSKFLGHTEYIAYRTKSDNFVMMMAGKKLRIALVTIHLSLKEAAASLSTENILKTIEITHRSLKTSFGLKKPRIAVAGLNPHAGEQGLFGSEEKEIISPAVRKAAEKGMDVFGPFPPDTVFYHAYKGRYDTVVCMYHDQGLIPFKLLHFMDGVNTTLGLPVIRTSVDHGTAYDIAGTGSADSGSMAAAIRMATSQADFLAENQEAS
jgi:4-hydroxythreonine-4-phosphate dehydrogenase